MKRFLFLLAACLALVSCGLNSGHGKTGQAQQKDTMKNYVEVMYFHGKQRCATCIAIDKNARMAVEENFAPQMKDGSVVYKVIDISKSENQAIAEKYEVTWSALFVVKHKDGKETFENMTEFAFGNARKSPEKFREGVVKTVNSMLGQ